MAVQVQLRDKQENDVVTLYSVDAREWLASNPDRYEPIDANTAATLNAKPRQITAADVMTGMNLDPKSLETESAEPEKRRPGRPAGSKNRE